MENETMQIKTTLINGLSIRTQINILIRDIEIDCQDDDGSHYQILMNSDVYKKLNQEMYGLVSEISIRGAKIIVDNFSEANSITVRKRKTDIPYYTFYAGGRKSGRYPWRSEYDNVSIDIQNVIFNDPATVVYWIDGTKTVVKAENESFDPEKGLAMAICKKTLGNKGNYYEKFKQWLPAKHVKKNPDGVTAVITLNSEDSSWIKERMLGSVMSGVASISRPSNPVININNKSEDD